MKEVTKWDGNPREMWVWDEWEEDRKKKFVVYISEKSDCFPVITETDGRYIHCAEIEEEEPRMMTHQELSRWLRDGKYRELKVGDNDIRCVHDYMESDSLLEVPKDWLIREEYGKWERAYHPTMEITVSIPKDIFINGCKNEQKNDK